MLIHVHLSQYIYGGALNEALFEAAGALLAKTKQAQNIIGPVPWQMSEDETKINSDVQFCLRSNELVGFCGIQSDTHKCDVAGARVYLPYASAEEPGTGQLVTVASDSSSFC